MPQNFTDPTQGDDNLTPENQEEQTERFESDTQRIIHRHLQNKNDVITEEDIRSIRVGMTPELDEATTARFEDEKATDNAEEELLGDEDQIEEPASKGDDRVTPWDTVDPK